MSWGRGVVGSILGHLSVVAAAALGLSRPVEVPPVSVTVSPPGSLDMFAAATPEFTAPAAIPEPDEPAIEFVPDRDGDAPVRLEKRPPSFDRPLDFTAERRSEPVVAPAGFSNPPPAYPIAARRRGLEGEVVVEVTVRADGSCADARVVERAGSELFVASVLDAVRAWTYRPATRGGVPVECRHRVRFIFKLTA